MDLYPAAMKRCPNCRSRHYEPNQSPFLSEGTILAGRYLVGRKTDPSSLTAGQCSADYIGWDPTEERKVTIKEYLPRQIVTRNENSDSIRVSDSVRSQEDFSRGKKGFVETAKALMQCQLPGIERVYDCFEENNTAYAITEQVDGILLSDMIKRDAPFTENQVLNVMRPILKDLDRLHEKGVIHRQIHPEVIWFRRKGPYYQAVLGGFLDIYMHRVGQTVVIESEFSKYKAEELFSRDGHAGPASDVYSISAVMFEMITGMKPVFASKRRFDLAQGDKNDPFNEIKKRNPDISAAFDNALQNGLSIKAENRTRSIKVLLEEMTSKEPVDRHDTTWNAMSRFEQRKWRTGKR